MKKFLVMLILSLIMVTGIGCGEELKKSTMPPIPTLSDPNEIILTEDILVEDILVEDIIKE